MNLINLRLHRSGFTLVELLVVIFIIGVLVALLLPAIQAAREAARRATCKNHLRQLALAAITHEEQIGWYPTGGWGSYFADRDRGFGAQQPGGWAYNVLPFLEALHLHNLPADGDPSDVTDEQLEGVERLIESPIEIINCPSRRGSDTYPLLPPLAAYTLLTDKGGKLDYAINYGSIPSGRELGSVVFVPSSTNFPWNTKGDLVKHLNDGISPWNGVSFVGSEISSRHVTDGTSTTYLIGEKAWPLNPALATPGDHGPWVMGHNWNGDVCRGGYRPPVPDRDQPGINSDPTWLLFGSAHESGLHMAYCDGSVRVVSYDVDLPVHQAAANRYDGLVFGN